MKLRCHLRSRFPGILFLGPRMHRMTENRSEILLEIEVPSGARMLLHETCPQEEDSSRFLLFHPSVPFLPTRPVFKKPERKNSLPPPLSEREFRDAMPSFLPDSSKPVDRHRRSASPIEASLGLSLHSSARDSMGQMRPARNPAPQLI